MNNNLGNLGVRECQAASIVLVGINHDLVDAARGKQFLVDDGADVQGLGLVDELDVLDLCNGLLHIICFGNHARHHVHGTVITQGDEGVIVTHALLLVEFRVAEVALHKFAVGVALGQFFATGLAFLDDFDVNALAQALDELFGDVVATHDEHVVDNGLLLAAHFPHFFDVVVRRGDVDDVVLQHAVIATRDDDLAVALDGRHVQEVADLGHVFEHLVDDARVGTYLDADHDEFAVEQFKPVSCPGAFQRARDFLGGKHLGIDEVVDTQGREVRAPVLVEELVIVDACHRLACAQFFSHGARQDVAGLALGDSDEQVALARLDGVEVTERDGASLMR